METGLTDEFGARNATEGELLVRVRPTHVLAEADLADDPAGRHAGALDQRAQLPNATSRGRYFMPQSGPTCSRSSGITVDAGLDPAGDVVGRLHPGVVVEVEHADDDGLAGDRLEQPRVELGLGGLDGEDVGGAIGELGEERVAGWPVVDDVGVAEAGVQRGRACGGGERALDGGERRTRAPGRRATAATARRAARRRRRPRRS